MNRIPEEYFWAHVIKNKDGCWGWTGNLAGQKACWYGHFGANGKEIYAHRFSYELHYGPIPEGMEVCHSCDNGTCTRPDHLFLGTHLDNMRDRRVKGRNFVKLGDRSPRALLTDEQVLRIRQSRKQGCKEADLAIAYGVSPKTISAIIRYRTYKDVVPLALQVQPEA